MVEKPHGSVPAEPVAKLPRNVHTTVDIAAPVDVDAIARDVGLSKDEREAFERRLKEAKEWLKADEGRISRLRDSPIRVLGERFKGIERQIPKQLADAIDGGSLSACSAGPPSGLYNECSLELLRRVGVWVSQGPGNRNTFVTNPDAAVDAVAGSAPVEAVLLVKSALRAARQYP